MKSKAWFGLVAALFFSTGCELLWEWYYGDVDEPCADVWEPVCGRDGVTYPNACVARQEGVAVANRGECEDDCRLDRNVRCEVMCDCPRIWEPVCDAAGNVYANRCFARCAEAGEVEPCDVDRCACPDVWEPVCDARGNVYANRCEARCLGETRVRPCDREGDPVPPREPGEDCECPLLWAPVCTADGSVYPNRCVAACEGVYDVVPCES